MKSISEHNKSIIQER